MKHLLGVMIQGNMSVSGRDGLLTNWEGHEWPKVHSFAERQVGAAHKCKIFMQDGVPCHRSIIVTVLEEKEYQKSLTGLGTVLI